MYDNTQEFADKDTDLYNLVSFVNYTEGIYVGYKFYETAAVEGLIDYETTVQYPFGYGLSYTTFTQTMGDIEGKRRRNHHGGCNRNQHRQCGR